MKTKGAVVVFVFLYSALLVKAAANVPFDGYLVLDGNDDIATTNISVSTGDEITVETFFLLETGSNSPIDRLEIVASSNWKLYVIRYSLGGTRTGCIGYLGPGGWEHCRTSTIGLNIWHHLAFTVKNGQGRFFLNGEAFGDPHTIPMPALSGTLTVGNNLNGNIDELRISDIARYDANFAPPSQKFLCDNNTITLWGFDESEGSTNFSDRCGGPSLLGENGAHSEGGLVLAINAFLPLVIK